MRKQTVVKLSAAPAADALDLKLGTEHRRQKNSQKNVTKAYTIRNYKGKKKLCKLYTNPTLCSL